MLEEKRRLLEEMNKLQHRYELSETVGPDYFEPGMMEYLDKYLGKYDNDNQEMIIRFEAKGTRYEGRTEILERTYTGDSIAVVREKDNPYNSNNFKLIDSKKHNLGNMPAELCNAIAPLYDAGEAEFIGSHISFVDPLSKRSRYAKQAVFFVELHIGISMEEELLRKDEAEEMFDFLDGLM